MVSPTQILSRTCHVCLNEYVDRYISMAGNRLLPNDGRNLNIFFMSKTIFEPYFIKTKVFNCCILIHLLNLG